MLPIAIIGASEASPTHERVSIEIGYVYMFIGQCVKVNACPFPAAMFKRQH